MDRFRPGGLIRYAQISLALGALQLVAKILDVKGFKMTDLFYYEKKNFSGVYTPITSRDRPEEKLTGGGRQNIRCVKLVNPNHQKLSLTQLENSYGTNGKFARGQGEI